MFVHRVAGPSRLSMPAKLAPARSRRTRAVTVEGLGCFILVQRHKSGMRHNPNLGTQDPRDRRKKKDLGDHEAMKKQGKQIAKMGKRGQERKPIDATVFPTLDVELIEEHKYPRQLYFPYMPPRLRDWPMFADFSFENVFFFFAAPVYGVRRLIRERRLPHWAVFRRRFWTRTVLSMPKRTFGALNQIRIATNEALALPAPAIDVSLEDQKTGSPSSVRFIAAPGAAEPSLELSGSSIMMVSQASAAPKENPLQATPAANKSNPPTNSPGITIVDDTNAALSDALQPPTSRVSRPRSKHWLYVFAILWFRRHPPYKWVRNTYMFLKPMYLPFHGFMQVVHGFMQKYWDWRYLDPGYWSPQRRREARVGMKRFRLDLWRDAVKYIQESEKYGKDARDYYMKKLENDRKNWAAMKLIAAHNQFPAHNFFKGLATRDPGDPRWYSSDHRDMRLDENPLFSDISSPKSLLSPFLKHVKELYMEMNRAVAAGRIDDLNQYAAKRYLNEIERRATSVRRGRENMSQTWRFKGWVNYPQCISIRAKDFLADYGGAFQGDHLVLNLLMKFDTLQSLATVEKPEARRGSRRNRKVNKVTETRRVTEYIIVDFRTWTWERKPRFIQEIYPDQKLEVVTNQMTEAKMLRQLKKQAAKESEENEAEKMDGQGKATALNPIT